MNKRMVWVRVACVTALAGGIAGLACARHAEPPPHFALVLDQVQMRRVPSGSNVSGSIAYQIDVFVGHKGPTPSWWGQQTGFFTGYHSTKAIMATNGPQLLRPCFIDKKGKKSQWNPCEMLNGLYDPARQEYYVDCNVEIDGLDDVDVRNSMVVGTIQMGDGSTLPVVAPTHLALEHPPKPSPPNPSP